MLEYPTPSPEGLPQELIAQEPSNTICVSDLGDLEMPLATTSDKEPPKRSERQQAIYTTKAWSRSTTPVWSLKRAWTRQNQSCSERSCTHCCQQRHVRYCRQVIYRRQSPHARTEKAMGSRAAKDMDTRICWDVYSPVTLKCAQEFVLVTFHSHRASPNRQKHYH